MKWSYSFGHTFRVVRIESMCGQSLYLGSISISTDLLIPILSVVELKVIQNRMLIDLRTICHRYSYVNQIPCPLNYLPHQNQSSLDPISSINCPVQGLVLSPAATESRDSINTLTTSTAEPSSHSPSSFRRGPRVFILKICVDFSRFS